MMRYIFITIFLCASVVSAVEVDVQRLLATYVFVGTGSGVVVSTDGLVLTNYHVVGDADDVPVRFTDGRVCSTVLVGIDPVGDLALLRIIDAQGLPAVSLATAADMCVGQTVIAIGNPFGLGELDDTPTVTRGVLSAMRLVRDNYTDALQIDAAVNPGNSGGPLFDEHGRLLGINGQIRTRSGFRVNSGIALAIACSNIAAFLPYLHDANGGYVYHTALPSGLELFDDDHGVIVRVPGKSGLQAGDRMLTIAGRAAISSTRSIGLFASLPWREGATIPISVERQQRLYEQRVPVGRTPIPGQPWHGIELSEHDGQLIIDAVEPQSPAAQAGCMPGDIITTFNTLPLRSRLDWIRSIARLGIGDSFTLHCRRDAIDQTMIIRLRPK